MMLFHFVPIESPYFVKEPLDVNGVRGQEVRVECKAAGFPVPKIKWTKVVGEYFEQVTYSHTHSYM